jgi:predicted nucleic-acid-binding Zn-ribbon protein
MFEVIEDTYLNECTFFCPKCGAKNYYYMDIDLTYDRCIYCKALMFPKPSRLLTSVTYRKFYHKNGAKFRKVYQNGKEEGPKVHTCGYSPY